MDATPDVVTIRQASPSDALGIARVFVASWRWAYRDLLPAPALEAMEASRYAAGWRETLRTRPASMRVWVAETGEAVVGFAQAGPSRDEDGPGVAGEVYAVYVTPERTGGGLGRELFDRALSFLDKAGYREAVLWVLASNERARRIYEGWGWRADGGRRETEWEGTRLDEVRYRLELGGGRRD